MPGKEAAGDVMKSSTKSNTKKMVQARLPFKRLNPVPKVEGCLEEKKLRIPQNVSPQKMLYSLNSSMEDMENDCEMETETTPIPKAINGKGPLDNYIRKAHKASSDPSIITIDLTEDSNISISNDSQLNGESRAQLANGTVSPERSPNAPLSTNEECTVSVKNKTLENMRFSELESDKQHQSSATCTSVSSFSPERAVKEDCSSSAEDDSASVSSSSSPVSLSSPDVRTGSKFTNGSSPSTSTTPTGKATANKTSAEKKKTKDKAEKRPTEKEERECARREARAAKDLAKKKREGEREQREKDKKEKKEREDKEKAEKNRLKEEKKKEKLEALEAKQEEKRKKEEEKRQKEEEKRLKEEEKRIKAEKAEITRFLQKPKTPQAPKTFARSCGKFAPFEIKKDMALAPLCRIDFEQEASEELDIFLQEQISESSFIDEIKKRKPRKMGQTTVPTVNSIEVDDVQVLGETDPVLGSNIVPEGHIKDIGVPERKKFGRMKLLQFCENHRPAYWGTSNKRSRVINPRKPWAQDTDILDYEVDSDEEWEEEEPGESLSHSEGENDDDDAKEEEDDDDDGFFVPHGYLSNDEGVSDEECTDPENQKVRQKLKAKEWDDLQSNGKKIRVLQPVVIGCVWYSSKASEIKLLQKFSACILESPAVEEELTQDISSAQKLKDRQILSKLVPLLHGNVNGSKIIIQEFQECCRRGLLLEDNASHATDIESTSPNSTPQTPSNIIVPSKARLKRLISENSVYEKRPEHRLCWYVHSDVLRGLQQDHLPVPCQWTYITQVNSVSKDNNGLNGGSVQSLPLSGKRKSTGSMPITKFMKRAKDLETAANADMDGFQADTEEEDDDDCMIIEDQQAKDAEDSTIECKINLNDSAVLASCQN